MNKEKIKIACIMGTRPEVIKMAPLIQALSAMKLYDVDIINTAQHRSLIDDLLAIFSIKPDIDLDIMKPNQSLSELTGNLFIKLNKVIVENNYQLILAQGDTTTTLVAAQIAFYNRIVFGHIEAGLRSYDLLRPFPEEFNRVVASKIATWHFTPTVIEEEILLKEGVSAKQIFTTGNTVIDSLYELVKRDAPLPSIVDPTKRVILVTMHRRESFGEPVRHVFSAFIELVKRFSDIQIIYPVHPNPQINSLAHEMLENVPNINLIEPLRYDTFVSLLNHAYFIMSDSGGIQEEAPALKKPILILREVTERPLVVDLGLGKLVGTSTEEIINAASTLLTDKLAYEAMQSNVSPYGDGHASERIIKVINHYFHENSALVSKDQL